MAYLYGTFTISIWSNKDSVLLKLKMDWNSVMGLNGFSV
ncbi:hypothetical protein LEP1GSC008_2357 [Leptospira kirschneri serovar Bulgarica str. Nikolaevo]|uniref:Uncharacterized protein n=1 Tax=Leptospira kirschneri serovar Bulgarica str. Nikolaevo TaxID=1240687 RepID=M6FAQ4_9LEPT|nr:hypothetical protein LEP1GSC008_2357 [Leptospira kirschneri serovar Bulgarica str. Nikolaevo]